ncbi:hypothetical protein LCGC14_2980670 [marine sediment metagenome]|uniref:Uncharacterized protein n=1 Tax=marine sediment metagenome TaxID=412755 RepID=A0A0F8X6N2_9ZZZZ
MPHPALAYKRWVARENGWKDREDKTTPELKTEGINWPSRWLIVIVIAIFVIGGLMCNGM